MNYQIWEINLSLSLSLCKFPISNSFLDRNRISKKLSKNNFSKLQLLYFKPTYISKWIVIHSDNHIHSKTNGHWSSNHPRFHLFVFRISRDGFKIQSDRSIRFAIDTPDCSNPPQRKGEDRIGEVAVREIFRKKKVRGRSSAPLPRHLKEFSIFRLRAEDLLKLD